VERVLPRLPLKGKPKNVLRAKKFFGLGQNFFGLKAFFGLFIPRGLG
jgi:hypothetical protein